MKALDDITVLACEHAEVGPSGTYPLAFMGATIIMVEPPGKGQLARTVRPTPKRGIDTFHHICLNMNKQSITLNLRHPKAVEMFKEMAKKVDIVHNNYSAGALEKLGVGYEDLKKVNPRIIYSSAKGFCSGGPYEKFLSLDGIAQAMSSSYSQTGWPDKPPITPGVSLGDTGTGMFSTGAILAALHHRDVTGEGQLVEISMLESSMNYNRANYALKQAEKDPLFKGPSIPRLGNTFPGIAPHNIYKTMDTPINENYLFITCREQKQWDALLRVIGRADLIGAPRFKDANTRWQNVAEVDQIIEEWTSKQRAFDAFHSLARAGVPVGVTQNSTQMQSDPHYIGREMIMELDHPHRGRYKTFGCAWKLTDSKVDYYQTAPLLGQHNQEVYAKFLGLTHLELTPLYAEGVI